MSKPPPDIPKKEYPADVQGYKIICEIGRGASATVFKARCIPLNENVAIKILDLETLPGQIEDSLVCLFIPFTLDSHLHYC